MNTYKTLDAAKTAGRENRAAQYIVAITHKIDGDCYICSRVPAEILKANIDKIDGVESVGAEFDIYDPIEQIDKCERCGSTNVTYSQEETYKGLRVIAHYCADCAKLTAHMADRRNSGHSIEPDYKN